MIYNTKDPIYCVFILLILKKKKTKKLPLTVALLVFLPVPQSTVGQGPPTGLTWRWSLGTVHWEAGAEGGQNTHPPASTASKHAWEELCWLAKEPCFNLLGPGKLFWCSSPKCSLQAKCRVFLQWAKVRKFPLF